MDSIPIRTESHLHHNASERIRQAAIARFTTEERSALWGILGKEIELAERASPELSDDALAAELDQWMTPADRELWAQYLAALILEGHGGRPQ
jgi:hypothetical protein